MKGVVEKCNSRTFVFRLCFDSVAGWSPLFQGGRRAAKGKHCRLNGFSILPQREKRDKLDQIVSLAKADVSLRKEKSDSLFFLSAGINAAVI